MSLAVEVNIEAEGDASSVVVGVLVAEVTKGSRDAAVRRRGSAGNDTLWVDESPSRAFDVGNDMMSKIKLCLVALSPVTCSGTFKMVCRDRSGSLQGDVLGRSADLNDLL